MKDKIVIFFDEAEEVKQISNIKEAFGIAEKYNQEAVEKYCSDYDLDYDTLSKEEVSEAAGYESGTLKLYKTNDLIEEIKKSDMLDEEKDYLLDILENTYESLNISDYDDLDTMLENCEEIDIYENYDNL